MSDAIATRLGDSAGLRILRSGTTRWGAAIPCPFARELYRCHTQARVVCLRCRLRDQMEVLLRVSVPVDRGCADSAHEPVSTGG